MNLRFYNLDRIPFTNSIQFDLELWHWAKTVINYAPMSYWYLKPGGSCNIKPDPEAVKKAVCLKKSDLIKPKPITNGILEGENLRVLDMSNGSYQIQGSNEWGWSNNAQLWWIAGSGDASLKADFIVPEAGSYKLRLFYTKAIDYGNFQIAINHELNPKTFVGYHNQKGKDVITSSSNLGTYKLKKGVNTLTLYTKGSHPKAIKKYMVGIDCIKLSKIW